MDRLWPGRMQTAGVDTRPAAAGPGATPALTADMPRVAQEADGAQPALKEVMHQARPEADGARPAQKEDTHQVSTEAAGALQELTEGTRQVSTEAVGLQPPLITHLTPTIHTMVQLILHTILRQRLMFTGAGATTAVAGQLPARLLQELL